MTPTEVIDELTEATGRQWRLDGRCPGGEVGAYFVSGTDDRFVMKWSERAHAADDLRATVGLLQQAHRRGMPMPLYRDPIVTDSAIVVLQERVDDGAAVDAVSNDLLDQLLAAWRLASAVADPSDGWTDFLRHTLTHGADGWCLHEPLAEHSAETRSILHWATRVGEGIETLPSGDLVHIDLHHRNLLQRADHLVAIIDWEGAVIGDHLFDLVTFVFNLAAADAEPDVERRVWRLIKQIGRPEAVEAYAAHMSIRMVDWQIRHHPEAIEFWVDRANTVRDLVRTD